MTGLLAAATTGQLPLAAWVSILVGLVTLGTVLAKVAKWAGQTEQHLEQQDAATAAQNKTLDAQNAAIAALHAKLDALGGPRDAA